MKTPIEELIETFEEMNTGYKPTIDVSLALSFMRSMLEKEKEVMCEFAWEYERDCRINLERSIEKCWDKTFNTKEK
jgi:hypothetical protein